MQHLDKALQRSHCILEGLRMSEQEWEAVCRSPRKPHLRESYKILQSSSSWTCVEQGLCPTLRRCYRSYWQHAEGGAKSSRDFKRLRKFIEHHWTYWNILKPHWIWHAKRALHWLDLLKKWATISPRKDTVRICKLFGPNRCYKKLYRRSAMRDSRTLELPWFLEHAGVFCIFWDISIIIFIYIYIYVLSILVCRMDMQKWWPNCQSITVEKWQISFRTFVAMFDFMPSVLQGQRNFLECWGRPDGQHHWRQRRPSQVLHCILAGQYSLVRFGKFQMDPNGSPSWKKMVLQLTCTIFQLIC